MGELEENTINKRLFIAFEAMDKTPYKVSKEISISETALSNIKNGKTKPSATLLEDILNKYKVISAEYLMRGIGNVFVDSSSEQKLAPKSTPEPNNPKYLLDRIEELAAEKALLKKELEELRRNMEQKLAKPAVEMAEH